MWSGQTGGSRFAFQAERTLCKTHRGACRLPKGDPVQILHRLAGSIQRYAEELSDPDRYRPDHCPQYETHRPLRAHGFYTRTLVDIAFDGTIRIRRYLRHWALRVNR